MCLKVKHYINILCVLLVSICLVVTPLSALFSYEKLGGYDWENFKGEVNYHMNHPEDNNFIPTIKKQVWLFLLNDGYSKEAAAGVMGNMMAEGSFDPTVTEGHVPWESFPWWSERAGGGLGIVGFTAISLKTELGEACVAANVEWTCLDVQLKVLMKQLERAINSKPHDNRFASYSDFKKSNSVRDVAISMVMNYEICQGYNTSAVWDKRAGFGQEAYDEFKDVTGKYDPKNNPEAVGGQGLGDGSNCHNAGGGWENIPICDDVSDVKICTPASALTSPEKDQYKFFHDNKYGEVQFDDLGFAYIMDKDPESGKDVKYYACALTCYYMKDVGEKFRMTLKSGFQIYIITCDITWYVDSSEGSLSHKVDNWRTDNVDKNIYGNPKYCIGDGTKNGDGKKDGRILEFYTEDASVQKAKFKAAGHTFTGHFEKDYDDEHKFAGPMKKMERLTDSKTVCDDGESNKTVSSGDSLVDEWDLTGMPTKPEMAEQQIYLDPATKDDFQSMERYSMAQIKAMVEAENKDALHYLVNRVVTTVGLCVCLYAVLLILALLFDEASIFGSLLSIVTLGKMQINKSDRLNGGHLSASELVHDTTARKVLFSAISLLTIGIGILIGSYFQTFNNIYDILVGMIF